ncbi:MAG: DUF2079 domain-containing protein [Terrimicrobiaceae bacterium]
MSTRLFTKRYVAGLAVFSGLFFAVMLSFFFYDLATTTSEYSVGGVAAPHQFFYNFLHGRVFQTSLYASKLAGASVGFSSNPHAYIHTYVIHVYLTPFLFAPLWNLWPNLYWLYGLVFVVNYIAMGVFAWKALAFLSPKTFPVKTVAALGLLFASGFLFTFQQNAQLMLFGGPFIMAAYYFLLTKRKLLFFASTVLVCLTSEDLAMVMLTFSVYIILFEQKAKSYAVIAGSFALAYLALVLLVVQPAARSELVLSTSSTTQFVLAEILQFFPANIPQLVIGFAPALFFFPSFGIVWLLFGKPDVFWPQVAGLMFLAPLPHWGQSAVVGASHHMMPPIVFVFAALVLVLGRTPDVQLAGATFPKKKAFLLFGVSAMFLSGSLRIMASNLPDHLLEPVYRLVGKQKKAEAIALGASEQANNRRILEVVDRLPKEGSLVFLTNSSLEGFIAGRSDLWKFPDYYDAADFLIIQPNAKQSFFSFSMDGHQSLKEALSAGKNAGADDALVYEDSARAIMRDLVVEKKTHRVVMNEPSVLLLERVEKIPVHTPPSTVEFGWAKKLLK